MKKLYLLLTLFPASLSAQTWTTFNTGNSGITDNMIWDIAVNPNDNSKWFGGFNNGVIHYNDSTWTVHNLSTGAFSNQICPVRIDTNGTIWAGTYGQGVQSLTGNVWTNYTPTNSGLAGTYVYGMTTDENGVKYFPTRHNGLSTFDGTTWTTYNTSTSNIPTNALISALYDPFMNCTWIGTTGGGGLLKFDGINFTSYTPQNSGLPQEDIYSLTIDSLGNKWIGTFSGLTKFDGVNSWTTYSSSNSGLPNNYVRDILAWSNDIIFAATGSGGLAKLHIPTNSWTVYNKSNSGIPCDSIWAVAKEGNDKVWVGTWTRGAAVMHDPSLALDGITVRGNIFYDLNTNCSFDTLEQGLPFFVSTNPGGHLAFPDSNGSYGLYLTEGVNYIISPIIPQRFTHMVSSICPPSYSFQSNTPIDTAGFDFGLDIIPCHQLRVDISSNRRRRCFRNNTQVYYVNEGLAAASGVEVKVKMPEYVIPLTSSLPYVYDAADSSMVFSIGTLGVQQSGTISIIDSVACVQGIMGLTQCTEATISPANICLNDSSAGSSWDKSSVKVEGKCVNDTIIFSIINTGDPGDGDMAGPSEYRIYADNILSQTVNFQLNGGDTLFVTVVSGGATIRLEADQRPGHPGNSQPRETIEACGSDSTGTFSTGMVDLVAQDDEDLHIEIDCLPVIDSYDPNDKKVSPSGFGTNSMVEPGNSLDFTIRFQNTGSDTAYKVVIVDTLSEHLDITTFEAGVSSYPYALDITGSSQPVLTFTFSDINLTDTMTNEPGSHGFVKYRVKHKQTISLGTTITNTAHIFFDFNTAITTNTTLVTIDSLSTTSSGGMQLDLGRSVAYPNPTTGILTVKTFEKSRVSVFTLLGSLVIKPISIEGEQKLNLSNLPSGTYILTIENDYGMEVKRIIKN